MDFYGSRRSIKKNGEQSLFFMGMTSPDRAGHRQQVFGPGRKIGRRGHGGDWRPGRNGPYGFVPFMTQNPRVRRMTEVPEKPERSKNPVTSPADGNRA